MKNLKRALSLVLATVMVIGMMVVGASAAGYNDLTDKDEIVNKEAVAVVSELGLIVGYDGKFMPDGTIDRAGMAKLICLALNGGKDPILGTQDTPTYTDIKGHWAESYIEWCSSLGIINGDGSGKFYPNAKLTGTAAAKMLLTALGYKSDVEGFVGDAWEINVNVKANMIGLYTNLDGINASANLSRDNAAQMVFNALNARMVSYTNPVTVNGVVIGNSQLVVGTKTMLEDRFGVTKVEGTVVANEWAALDKNVNSALKAGLTRIENAEGIFADGTSVKVATFNVSTPVEMLGQTVTLYIKKASILAKSEVVGTAVASTVNAVTTVGYGDLDDLLDEASLTTDETTEYYYNYGQVAAKDLKAKVGAALTVIDNNSDGVAEYVLNVEKILSDVTNYNTKNETIAIRSLGNLAAEDVMGYDDVTKGDVVLYVQYGGRTYVEIPETVTGKMTSYNVKGTEKYMVVDGVKYHDDKLDTKTATKFDVLKCNDSAKTGVQFAVVYNFYMDDFGNVIAFEKVSEAAKNYALVLDSAFSTNMLSTDAQVKVLMPNGETETYKLDWAASVKNFTNATELKNFLGSDDWTGAGTYPAAGAAKGNLIAYTLNDNDEMVITLADLTVGGNVNGDGTKNTVVYGQTGKELLLDPTATAYFGLGTISLAAKLEQGDVEVTLDDLGGIEHDSKYGIDADTTVYYYDGKNAHVVTGYDDMAKVINPTATGDVIDLYRTAVAIIDTDKDDVANIMVIYTSQAKFGADEYVFVMPEYNVYGAYYLYTVINTDGTVETIKSNDDLRGILGTDGTVCTVEYDAKGVADLTIASSVVKGYVRVTNTKYVNIFKTVGSAIQNANTATEWLDLSQLSGAERLASRNDDVIFDVANTANDADYATTTSFEDGQYAFVVDDGAHGVVAAFITKTYLTENPTITGTKPGTSSLTLKGVTLDTAQIDVAITERSSATITIELRAKYDDGNYYPVTTMSQALTKGTPSTASFTKLTVLQIRNLYEVVVYDNNGEIIGTATNLMYMG